MRKATNLAWGNCGWANQETKWFLQFNTSNDMWAEIVAELKTKGLNVVQEKKRKL